MADVHDPVTRSYNMSQVKSKNTKPELLLRKKLYSMGIRYRINNQNIIGKPDITIQKYKLVIFVDGDFWHGRNWQIKKFEIKSRREFWWPKIEKTIHRDEKVTHTLKSNGWTVVRIWEKDILENSDIYINKIYNIIKKRKNEEIQ
ncbi:MAG: very short patch repair endonuclease [Cytophagales bacterium]